MGLDEMRQKIEVDSIESKSRREEVFKCIPLIQYER